MRRKNIRLRELSRLRLIATCALVLLCLEAVHGGESGSLVRIGPDEKMVYGSARNGDRIPDFSHCGYMGGGVPIPAVPVGLTLSPSKGDGDDTAMIQLALDKLAQQDQNQDGFRGALLLKKGRYRVAGTITIKASGIVLRGEGNDREGTEILATGKKQRSLIGIGGGSPGKQRDETRKRIVDEMVPVGSLTFEVEPRHGFSVGDQVVVCREVNAAWIRELGMDRLSRGSKDPVKNWDPGSYGMAYARQITHVRENSITIDVPIVCAMEKRFGGGYVAKVADDSRIVQVGVEQLRLISEYEAGKENRDEDHAWNAIALGHVRNGWVRDVIALHFGYSCVNISGNATHITVQDCAMLDPVSQITGGRRYSFAVAGQLCLVQRCYARNGRHDYVMHARVPGPNVFLDCVADKAHSDSGPHHRWATGTLYDNIRCGDLNVVNRGRSGTGHGWVGATTVLWNCRAGKINCQKPPSANNYCIGCTAKGNISGDGHIESSGMPVAPRSLYLRQLEERLGGEPVEAVTTEAQRRGDLDEVLRKRFAD